MTDSDPKQGVAEAVRQKRLRSEQLEKVAATRASIGKFGTASFKRQARFTRVFIYVVWLVVTLYLLSLVPRFYEMLVAPLIDARFSPAAIREFAWQAAFFVGMFWLLFFYDKTPVRHLSRLRRAAVNVLLCGGGLAFIAACMLLAKTYDVAAVITIFGAGLVLWFARRCAKAPHT